jgi:hypothetical protein
VNKEKENNNGDKPIRMTDGEITNEMVDMKKT